MRKAKAEWPMANYEAAWKTFRRVGDEPVATALHVTSLEHWPKKNTIKVLDVGCGDGKMVAAFVLRARQTISQLVLLDPDEKLLGEAAKEVQSLHFGTKTTSVLSSAEDKAARCARGAHAALGIHLAYLMTPEAFRLFIEKWPRGVPLYIVLDAETSVFSAIWKNTAPEYARRATAARQYLDALGETVLKSRSEFATRVANPYMLVPPIRELVLSLFCYNDFEALIPAQQKNVKRTISKYADGKEVKCTCACYEIVK
jgi:SAM-dependent methyltransferase